MYPQSDGSLASVDIDASKGFFDLWVHLTFAIVEIFDVKRQLKLLEKACNQVQTCLIFPLRWACFPVKIGRNAQKVHLFSMDFDDSYPIYLIFQSKSPFSIVHPSFNGNTTYLRLLSIKGCDAIRPVLHFFVSMMISFA